MANSIVGQLVDENITIEDTPMEHDSTTPNPQPLTTNVWRKIKTDKKTTYSKEEYVLVTC